MQTNKAKLVDTMPKSDLVLLAIDDEQILQLFERALAAGSYGAAIARDRAALDMALQPKIRQGR